MSVCLPLLSHAAWSPYVRLSATQSYARVGQTHQIVFSPTYWKTDLTNEDRVSPLFAGFSAGIRVPISPLWESEVGVGFYQSQGFITSGKVYQYSTSNFYNLNYNYKIQHQSAMLEGKLLTNYLSIYHPYVSAGVGFNRNHSHAYQEIPVQPYAVPDPAFANATQSSMSYTLGVGVDIDILEHWRVGAGYAYTDVGSAILGVSPVQLTAQHINAGQINANQFTLQVTYAK